ncbi:GTP pyrophosphokinase family protein [uncultured Hymenobacter sp.]|uniref:GTP pyrophosphokinase n=1 Tax=uncultured Hymenobacter sp. TaxID=170016 RepID=UPI0035C953F1
MDFEGKYRAFSEFYHANFMLLNGAGEAYNSLIKSLASSQYNLQAVTYRVKDERGCIDKFREKYLKKVEAEGVDFEIKDYITDIIGVRVVCLYNSDIEPIGKLLKSHFDAIDETDKSGLLDNTDNQFGYRGLHLDLKLNSVRSFLPEYQDIHGFRFEVQIRSIIQDAWSVLDHKIKYKKSHLPAELKRSINRLAALFEIADNEFLRVKRETDLLETAASNAALTFTKSTQSSLLDVFNFQQIVESSFIGFKCTPNKTDEFLSQINKMNSMLTTAEFINIINNELKTVTLYQEFQKLNNGNSLNPITQIRHAFYLHDKDVFAEMLFNYQKNAFDEWLVSVTE